MLDVHVGPAESVFTDCCLSATTGCVGYGVRYQALGASEIQHVPVR